MDNNNLILQIDNLISTKREDDYWDFKQKHHQNAADLLHDIICMANNRVNKEAYIIFGVVDKTGEVIGVENDSFRRNQQQIIDQLKNKKFAGGVRPKIEMKTIDLYGHEIDVLTIKNTLDTPYYLIEDFTEKGRKVRANFIYTRTCDTNTDIDRSADPDQVEYLWKKRFGLHMSPFDKLHEMLQIREDWIENEDKYYHKQNPEFTISLEYEESERNSVNEFYSYVMTNEDTMFGHILANYFGTTLYSDGFVVLDSGRYVTVVPEWGFLHFDEYNRDPIGFKYYIKDDISYILHLFLFEEKKEEAVSARNRFLEVVLLFNNEDEKDNFIEYVQNSKEILENCIDQDITTYSWVLSNNETAQKAIIMRIKTGKALNKMLSDYRAAFQ